MNQIVEEKKEEAVTDEIEFINRSEMFCFDTHMGYSWFDDWLAKQLDPNEEGHKLFYCKKEVDHVVIGRVIPKIIY